MMEMNLYQKYRLCKLIESAEIMSDFIWDCSYEECGLTNCQKGEIRDYFFKLIETINRNLNGEIEA